jgi:hypothetical protein
MKVNMFTTAEEAVQVVDSSLDGLLCNLASKIYHLCEMKLTEYLHDKIFKCIIDAKCNLPNNSILKYSNLFIMSTHIISTELVIILC